MSSIETRARLHQRALAIARLRNFAPQAAQPPFNANLEDEAS
jgi:hypothetical protein